MGKYIEISIVTIILILFGISLYVINSDKDGKTIESIEVNIIDGDSLRFVTEQIVMDLLKSDRVKDWCTLQQSIKLDSLEMVIGSLPFVDSVEVYSILDKIISVNIKQSKIMFRIISDNGESFYIDDKLNLTDIVDYFTLNTHIVTCSSNFLHLIQKKGEKDCIYLKNLLNFVEIVEDDDFWNSMIVQIIVNQDHEIELVPRVGTHSVVLCGLDKVDQYNHYLGKLFTTYQGIAESKNWGKYKRIDTRYRDIVVATKYN